MIRPGLSAAGAALGLALVASACATKAAPVVPMGPDRYPEFVYPLIPDDLRASAAGMAPSHDEAWRWLQAGDPRAAERGFSTVLKQRTDFYPAETGLAYVELARNNERRALERFDRALTRAPSYVPALRGRGQTLLALGRSDEALEALEAVLAVDPSLTDVARRVETLRFRAWERALADAREAEHAGRYDEALAAYRKASAASPESPFLYRDMARLEQQLGRPDVALEHANRAIALDPADPSTYVLLADIHEARNQWDEAIAALERARDRDGSTSLDPRIESLRERVALARLPDEYRAIPNVDRVTRGQLAALIGVRLEALLRETQRRGSVLVTDVRNHWAAPWILNVARAGVIDPFENHTFQPGAAIRRGELARAVSGALALIAQRDPTLGRTWSGARMKFADLSPGNLFYPAASLAVAAGVLDVTAGQEFQMNRVVTGREAVQAIERLEKLAARAGRPQ